MQESKQMMHFMELIDEKRIQQVTKEITEWSDKNRMQLIIDQNGNVNRQWLFEDPAYVAFKDNEKKIQTQNNNWTNFQANSQTQISKINELSKLADNANVIAQLKSIHLYEDKKVSFNKIIYLVPSILSILFLLGIVVLLVIIITRL
jgi:hypothetical protein